MAGNALIRLRRDTAANWTSVNPVLGLGEPGFETDTKKMKLGDGSTAWSSLSYLSAAASVSDGDKGDITVSASGATWTIDPSVITLAKMADVATGTVFYRKTAATGAPEVQTLATLKTDLGLTGTNSGDQTITLTGDVTGTGTGSFATTIGANKVTDSMLRQSAGLSVIGRAANTTGNVADITGAANGVLRVSGTTLAFGAVDLATAMVTGRLPYANLTQGSALSVLGVTGSVTADVASIAAGTDDHVLRRSGTTLGFGTIATGGITDAAVTYAKIQNMTTGRLLGRTTAAAGVVEEITPGATMSFSAGALGVASVPNAATFNDGGAGATTGTTFDGSVARTVSYNTIGAQPAAPRIQSVASSATVTPTFADDQVIITAQAVALTLANPTGTAAEGKKIVVRIKDNGTARAISYGTQYRAIGVTLPTTTVISKTLYLGMIFNNTDTKWDVVSVAQEA